ncbi:phosphoglycolate phosphatase [Piscinibacter sp.]|uniref:phosphoglycolate phosphatase n=1 Tax=Piscinibacter sp. TaxID=1903157 RepID=UPI002C1005B0|nr:phosphoglycolate phosphatase [Albitalea sp.]HUG24669.1 phosphoglycolate phosphatase [Albitalea sp.]
MSPCSPRAVLFDLDGTLIDSAPDLAGAANELRAAHGLSALPYEHFRPMVGSGARGMVGVAFDVGPQHERFAELRDDFLRRYEQRMMLETRIFDAVVPVLDTLDARHHPWGIVTNKAARFTVPLVRSLGLHERAATVIAGDTTPHSKPHPAPLLEAARQMGLEPSECLYVGDDPRDVQAGLAAGMTTVVAAWGYLGIGEPLEAWGARHIIKTPAELLNLLGMA